MEVKFKWKTTVIDGKKKALFVREIEFPIVGEFEGAFVTKHFALNTETGEVTPLRGITEVEDFFIPRGRILNAPSEIAAYSRQVHHSWSGGKTAEALGRSRLHQEWFEIIPWIGPDDPWFQHESQAEAYIAACEAAMTERGIAFDSHKWDVMHDTRNGGYTVFYLGNLSYDAPPQSDWRTWEPETPIDVAPPSEPPAKPKRV